MVATLEGTGQRILHRGIEGNEVADKLAKRAVSSERKNRSGRFFLWMRGEGRRGAGTTDDKNVKQNRGEWHRHKRPPRTNRNYTRQSMKIEHKLSKSVCTKKMPHMYKILFNGIFIKIKEKKVRTHKFYNCDYFTPTQIHNQIFRKTGNQIDTFSFF